MRKAILKTTAWFLGIVVAVVVAGLAMSLLTPSLNSAAATDVPVEIHRITEIRNMQYSKEEGGYVIRLNLAPSSETLSLSMNNRSYDVYQNGVRIFKADRAAGNQYAIPIPLKSAFGYVELLLVSHREPEKVNLISFSSVQVPRVFIGREKELQDILSVMTEIQLILIGIHGAMAVVLLMFFLKKREETELMQSAIIAGALTFMTMGLMNSSLIHIGYDLYSRTIGLLFILPMSLVVYICLHGTRAYCPVTIQHLIGMPVIIGTAVVGVAIQNIFHINVNNVLHRVYVVPVLYAFACADHAGERKVKKLMITYAISEGIAFYLYLLGRYNVLPYGFISMYLRPTQLMYTPFLLVCLTQAVDTFTEHFSNAEITAAEECEMNKRLDILVKEKTQALVLEQRKRNEMMLQIFHDLRSPIFVLKAGLKQMDAAHEMDKGLLRTLRYRTDYLARLTENLFTAAQLDEKKIVYDQDYVQIDRMLEMVFASEMVTAEAKGVKLQCGQFEKCCTWGDAIRLQQVVLNLIDNAIAYTPCCGEIYIENECDDSTILIRVRDTGCGIPQEELGRVFERYHHIGKSGNSTGLGLYIAREIVHDHGGAISAESMVGYGSTFTVKLPLCRTEEEPDDTSTAD